ncbi:hypothetical protein GS597_18955 [Synechococcales cyanobacterium C]|uniref:Uncharacterized protein n=1 Tax=Petrachloros mirabilis ULC683 TaxID=2781853 RepID=A0A8K2A066_9CYAN|nr:hypothetical protein [Petrachloros mirabilis]NCJ08550.1 hypothetical protein [Petrachloros mirabilis ULC683]
MYSRVSLKGGGLRSTVTTLDQTQIVQNQSLSPRRIVGVGNVDHLAAPTYTLYTPGTNQVSFRTVKFHQISGFGGLHSRH